MTDLFKSGISSGFNEISRESYERFCRFLNNRCGISLSDDKQYLVENRLRSILFDQQIPSLEYLLDFIENSRNVALENRIIDAMTTNETFWFRDECFFDYLKNVLIPDFIYSSSNGKNIDIWSAASSSGQEAYSISIVIEECLKKINKNSYEKNFPNFRIIGTDISMAMIHHAKEALYSSLELSRGLPDEYRRHYFDEISDHSAHLKKIIRDRVSFFRHNLQDSFENFGLFDLILCRNVLIYFDDETVRDILSRFHASLKPGGILILSASEAIQNLSNLYQPESIPGGFIYRAIKK